MYNEMVLLKLVQSMTKLICNPPEIFSEQILAHFSARGQGMYERIKCWMDASNEANRKANGEFLLLINLPSILTSNLPVDASTPSIPESSSSSSPIMPDFPLIPASRGFCLTLVGLLENLRKTLKSIDGGPTV